MRVYKFYEVECQLNNLYWQNLAYFRKEEDAQEYAKIYEQKRKTSYPVRIEEKEFANLKDLK